MDDQIVEKILTDFEPLELNEHIIESFRSALELVYFKAHNAGYESAQKVHQESLDRLHSGLKDIMHVI